MKYEPHNYSWKLGHLTKHHRLPRKLGGESTRENISFVPEKLHQAFHLLFGANSAEKIAQELNDNWVDPNYVMVAVPKNCLPIVEQAIYGTNDY
jgi:hypothetical protein